MSRSEQYIGLTKAARSFLERVGAEYVGTTMIDECAPFSHQPIMGEVWEIEDNNIIMRFIETLQAFPWSSGPLYFTCLRFEQICGWKTEDLGKRFLWVENPYVYGEVDYENGEYWV